MGTISNARAIFGLVATGTPTKTLVSGAATIGQTQSQIQIPADVAYAFTVENLAANAVVELTFSTCEAVVSSGSALILDGDGNDFEGLEIPTVNTTYVVLVESDPENIGEVLIKQAAAAPNSGFRSVPPLPFMSNVDSPTLALSGTDAADKYTVTVIASTT